MVLSEEVQPGLVALPNRVGGDSETASLYDEPPATEAETRLRVEIVGLREENADLRARLSLAERALEWSGGSPAAKAIWRWKRQNALQREHLEAAEELAEWEAEVSEAAAEVSEALDVIRSEVVSLDQQTGAVLHDRDADFLAKQLEYEEHHRNLVEEHQREAEKQSARLATLAANAHISALAVVQRASSVHADTAWEANPSAPPSAPATSPPSSPSRPPAIPVQASSEAEEAEGVDPVFARLRNAQTRDDLRLALLEEFGVKTPAPPPKTVTMAAGSSSQQPVRQAQAAASGYDGGSSSCCELSTAELTAKALLEAAAMREAAEAEAEASEPPTPLSPGRGGGGGQAAASSSSLGGGEATIATLTNLIAEAIVNAAKQLHSRGEEKAAAALTAVVSASSTAASPSARALPQPPPPRPPPSDDGLSSIGDEASVGDFEEAAARVAAAREAAVPTRQPPPPQKPKPKPPPPPPPLPQQSWPWSERRNEWLERQKQMQQPRRTAVAAAALRNDLAARERMMEQLEKMRTERGKLRLSGSPPRPEQQQAEEGGASSRLEDGGGGPEVEEMEAEGEEVEEEGGEEYYSRHVEEAEEQEEAYAAAAREVAAFREESREQSPGPPPPTAETQTPALPPAAERMAFSPGALDRMGNL